MVAEQKNERNESTDCTTEAEVFGYLNVREFLKRVNGRIYGKLLTDAKERHFKSTYSWRDDPSSDAHILVRRVNGTGDEIRMRVQIPLDRSLITFFGLYSGDGAKGSVSTTDRARIKPVVAFSQREHNLVRFAVSQFKRLFQGSVCFHFSLGEDSAYFMDGEGLDLLREAYGGQLPEPMSLEDVCPRLKVADQKFLSEQRPVPGQNRDHLAFYYQHKQQMEKILILRKKVELEQAGILLNAEDHVSASLRRPFKKGARQLGGSSRSDELYVKGVNGIGELFLKMLYDIEATIEADEHASAHELVVWTDRPSTIGKEVDVVDFFRTSPYGQLNGKRPELSLLSIGCLEGKWPRSKSVHLYRRVHIDPLWCYVAGLYLAEGNTPKSKMFAMFSEHVAKLSLGFTSSEGSSLDLMLRCLQKLFMIDDCLNTWKVKVGSQYFPELVVNGLKEGVPMLRGGASGDGKLRTIEISLAIKSWALEVAPALNSFSEKYSHVEPTGAGVPRIDFSTSSALCRWYFPLLMYGAFSETVADPSTGFTNNTNEHDNW